MNDAVEEESETEVDFESTKIYKRSDVAQSKSDAPQGI